MRRSVLLVLLVLALPVLVLVVACGGGGSAVNPDPVALEECLRSQSDTAFMNPVEGVVDMVIGETAGKGIRALTFPSLLPLETVWARRAIV